LFAANTFTSAVWVQNDVGVNIVHAARTGGPTLDIAALAAAIAGVRALSNAPKIAAPLSAVPAEFPDYARGIPPIAFCARSNEHAAYL
jgi:hypothetical protein